MATDETQNQEGQPPVVAEDLMAATDAKAEEASAETSAAPTTDESGTAPAEDTEVPPEQVTPAAGGPNVVVPSAAGEQTPPTSSPADAETTTAPGQTTVGPEAADAASPTGGANEAGIAQSQLNQAPPMADSSGSNIPAPNLVQPVATLPDAPSVSGPSDPAVADPAETAKAAQEGTVNDAAARASGDVEGQGDVEIATVPEGDGSNEYFPALSIEDEVTLVEHDLIADRLVGRRAFVVDAPRYLVPLDKLDEVWITVRTRDEINATLTIPLSACTIQRGGRSPVVRG